MSYIGDSCPVCRFGEVDEGICDRCKVEFCPLCHGLLHGRMSPNVDPCICDREQIKAV